MLWCPWRTQGKRGKHLEMLLTQVRPEGCVVDVLIHAGSHDPWEAENTHSRAWAVLCPGAEGLGPSPRSRLARGSSLAGTISSPFTLPLQKGHGVAEYQAEFLGSCKLLLSGCLLSLTNITQSSPHTFLHLGQNPVWVLLCSRRFGHV